MKYLPKFMVVMVITILMTGVGILFATPNQAQVQICSGPTQYSFLPVREDTYIDTMYPFSNFGADTNLLVGYDFTREQNVLLKFEPIADAIPGLTSNNCILEAMLYVSKNGGSGYTDVVNVHAVQGAWDEMLVTPFSAPGYSSGIYASSTLYSAWTNWHGLDVTQLVRDWLNGTEVEENGLALVPGKNYLYNLDSLDARENGPFTEAYIEILWQ